MISMYINLYLERYTHNNDYNDPDNGNDILAHN